VRHPGLYIRPLQPDDIDEVTRLLASSIPDENISADWLRETAFRDPDYDPDISLVALDGGTIAAYAMGILRHTSDGIRAWIKVFATAEDRRGTGVMSTLFDRIEAAFRRHGVAAVNIADSAPYYAWSGLDPGYTAAVAFLQSRGYKKTGETLDMLCDLRQSAWDTSSDTERLRGEGVVIRRATRSDMQPVFSFLRVQFPGWLREVATCFRQSSISLHLALVDGSPVAFAAYDGNYPRTGWFGPMGTAPESRRHGLGRVLLHCCLKDMRDQGCRTALIPWVGPVEFYAKHCGAIQSRRYWKMMKEL
jgi:mycothiol synthase